MVVHVCSIKFYAEDIRELSVVNLWIISKIVTISLKPEWSYFPGFTVATYSDPWGFCTLRHKFIKTPWHGNAFRATDPLWGNSAVGGGFPSDEKPWCFLSCKPEQTVDKQARDRWTEMYPRSWASYQIRQIAGCVCARNAGKVFPTTDFNGNPKLGIRACSTARTSRTCRDACRDR